MSTTLAIQFNARNQRLKRKHISYQEFLNSERWSQIKDYLRKERGYSYCQICGTGKSLNFHHLSYVRMFKPAKKQKNDIIVLCSDCHNKFHQLSYKNEWGLRQTWRNINRQMRKGVIAQAVFTKLNPQNGIIKVT